MMRDFVFTSESVTAGHPDKLCDRISDAIVDRFVALDPFARVEAECAVATGTLFLACRFASPVRLELPSIARETIARVGYVGGAFDAATCSILTSLAETTTAARLEVDEADLDDAGLEAVVATHQVTAFGFACRQTAELVPLPIALAHRLARGLERARAELPWLMPDGKVQVAVEYRDRRPARIHALAIVAALDPDRRPTPAALEEALRARVVEPSFADAELRPDAKTRLLINPGGPFLVGGPARHAGLTGRKTAIDTYGEYARHSGAALSGKDPGRIDRIGAYAARWAAKNVVAAGLAESCEVQLSWTIGLARPVSLVVETFGTGRIAEEAIAERLARAFDFRPAAIVRAFDLRRLPGRRPDGFFEALAAYGQVGRADLDLPWERLDRVEALAD
ncbi:MAG: S-adenosylmethionine synthase [Geminicoccaceae bacterium]|jgi:S-adenosylmethionine synthetase|nr:MAG: S-adenosylmethionine synthase [Geminicoccaceae bacterium]